jgi:hypothetical protein
MKKLSLFLMLAFFTTIAVNAQEVTQTQTRIREVGFYTGTIKDLSNIGIRYKFGTENLMFRITAVSLSIQNSSNSETDNEINQFGCGLYAGIEKPMVINERFSFYYGPQVGYRYSKNKASQNESDYVSTSSTVSLGCIAGISFKAVDKIYLSLEAVPSLSMAFGKNGNDKSYFFGLNNQAFAGLVIGVRF